MLLRSELQHTPVAVQAAQTHSRRQTCLKGPRWGQDLGALSFLGNPPRELCTQRRVKLSLSGMARTRCQGFRHTTTCRQDGLPQLGSSPDVQDEECGYNGIDAVAEGFHPLLAKGLMQVEAEDLCTVGRGVPVTCRHRREEPAQPMAMRPVWSSLPSSPRDWEWVAQEGSWCGCAEGWRVTTDVCLAPIWQSS